MKHLESLQAVTFDCWGTLLYEVDTTRAQVDRAAIFARTLKKLGVEVSQETARDALREAWKGHWRAWVAGVSTDAVDIAGWALESFEIREPAAASELGHELQRVSLGHEIQPLDGAVETLQSLARQGIRRALICDTGFSPGSVVRQLLDRVHLLEHLEVQIFSD